MIILKAGSRPALVSYLDTLITDRLTNKWLVLKLLSWQKSVKGEGLEDYDHITFKYLVLYLGLKICNFVYNFFPLGHRDHQIRQRLQIHQ